MEGEWNIDKIQEILPQRYPFLFIDKVIEVNEKEGRVTCLKNTTIGDYFFAGHFPANPIMPGALIIEALAQASIILFSVLKPQLAQRHPDYYLGKVEVRFRKPVLVGDQLILAVQGEKVLDRGGIIKAQAKVNDTVVAEARIVFGVKLPTGSDLQM